MIGFAFRRCSWDLFQKGFILSRSIVVTRTLKPDLFVLMMDVKPVESYVIRNGNRHNLCQSIIGNMNMKQTTHRHQVNVSEMSRRLRL